LFTILETDFLDSRECFISGEYKAHFLEETVLVKMSTWVLQAHNAQFDARMLNEELARCGMEQIPLSRIFCSMSFFKSVYPRVKYSLDSACALLKIDTSRRVCHGALLDASLTADLFIKLIDHLSPSN